MDTDRASWQRLITRIREVYGGALTYSGNWDHFEKVALYDLVDLAGLCAYFSLGKGGERPAVADLVAAWGPIKERLARLSAQLGRPLLFTEVGYLSQRGAAARPWEEGAKNPVDLEEQRRLYEAFRRAFGEGTAPFLAGAYFWNWYGWGGPASRGYTPRGKPAEGELRRYFSGLRHR